MPPEMGERCTCDARIVPGANHVAPCALYDAEEDAAIQRERAGRLIGATVRLEHRVAKLEAERQAILDCVNLYGDATLHDALDAAGLLLNTKKPA